MVLEKKLKEFTDIYMEIGYLDDRIENISKYIRILVENNAWAEMEFKVFNEDERVPKPKKRNPFADFMEEDDLAVYSGETESRVYNMFIDLSVTEAVEILSIMLKRHTERKNDLLTKAQELYGR